MKGVQKKKKKKKKESIIGVRARHWSSGRIFLSTPRINEDPYIPFRV